VPVFRVVRRAVAFGLAALAREAVLAAFRAAGFRVAVFAFVPLAARFVLVLRFAGARFAAGREAARCGVAPSSPVHLPDNTRCAASATASAMIEPSLVALDIMFVAACDAVSAASRPASRIARRAFGLALIAAAAAARPAASISLLIAALAILSIVSFELVELEDLDLLAFAMVFSLGCRERHLTAVTVPE
jgi:hypothetical protein